MIITKQEAGFNIRSSLTLVSFSTICHLVLVCPLVYVHHLLYESSK